MSQLEADDIAQDGADGEDACDDGHAGAGHHRLAVHDDIGDHGRGHADDHVGQCGTDGAPGGQLRTVLGVCRDGGSHGAVGDVDGGIEDGAPQDVGDEQPGHLEAIGHPGQAGLIDQEGSDGHRAAHPLDPGAELAVLGGLGVVHDLAHAHIGERIHKTGDHHHHANDGGVDAHDVGVELHQEARRQQEGEIVAEITEHVADLVLHAEGGGFLHLICHWFLLR